MAYNILALITIAVALVLAIISGSRSATSLERRPMPKIPVLQPVEPLAKCGLCNSLLFYNSRCQAATAFKPPNCPLFGRRWAELRGDEKENASVQQGAALASEALESEE